jgi:putative DNA primase/helicase
MDFYNFAEQHGLIIDHLIRDRWVRVPTSDKPQSRNGAYIYDGQSGAVQNWAVHEKPIAWFDKNAKHDPQLAVRKAKVTEDLELKQKATAGKASWILGQCVKQTHPYMAKKGFPNEKVNVWNGMMVIPMRIDGSLTGLQLISEDGKKTFLTGQKNKGATTIIDNKGMVILCEGVATAMSIRRALKAVKTRYTIVICFSAANILPVSKKYPDCFIVADHDAVGLRIASKTNRHYCWPPLEQEDFNDFEVRVGAKEAGEYLIAAIRMDYPE